MYIIKTCHGYCPVKNLDYFINVKYELCGINKYSKHSYECCYTSLYRNICPKYPDCPIFVMASDYVESK